MGSEEEDKRIKWNPKRKKSTPMSTINYLDVTKKPPLKKSEKHSEKKL